jgi:Na+-translocating ferredoxin:NAD+ oxidoreductase RnfG subunit
MKMKTAFFTLLLVAAMACGLSAATLNQTIASINADAKKDPAKAMQSISASTKVPVATLEKEKAKHANFSYGDLFAAHTIAKSSGKSFEDVAALKAKGDTWDKIADSVGVSLDGKKKTAQASTAKPSPTPTPQKTLRQIQAERYQ